MGRIAATRDPELYQEVVNMMPVPTWL